MDEIVFVRFPYCKDNFSSPIAYGTLWRAPRCYPDFRSKELRPTPWGQSIYIDSLEFSHLGNKSILPIYLFNYLYHYGLRNIYFIAYNSALFYLFCCSNCFRLSNWYLFLLAPVSFWNAPIIIFCLFLSTSSSFCQCKKLLAHLSYFQQWFSN